MDETAPQRPDRELVALLQNRVGRNVLRYQQIELLLKSAFRHMRFVPPPANADPEQLPGVELYETTLGGLFNEARQRVKVDAQSADLVWATFAQVLADRNALVHGLSHSKRNHLETNDGIRALIAELDVQHARCDLVFELALTLSAQTVLHAIEHGRLPEDERDSLRAGFFAALERSGLEVTTVEPDPVAAHIAAVVELVRQAEQDHGDAARGTHLSTAGHYVRRHFPDLKYRLLGFDDLQSLVSSHGFETWVESFSDGRAPVVRYRSRKDG